MEKYDLCIIGAGPSGYAAAMRAVDFNKKILLVEKQDIGGAGVTNGALSSKTWWELARNVDSLYTHKSRYNLSTPEINFNELRDEVAQAVQERKELMSSHLEKLREGEAAKQIKYINGSAFLKTPHIVEITTEEGLETIETEYIILATGSRPRKLPNIPIDEEIILTSDGISNLKEFPKSMVVLGAGVIGCEFTTIFFINENDESEPY